MQTGPYVVIDVFPEGPCGEGTGSTGWVQKFQTFKQKEPCGAGRRIPCALGAWLS